jgi:hypothetical protein
METFKDMPISVGERRGAEDINQMAPRDLLISILRKIDNKEMNIEGLVVSYFWRENGGVVTGMKRAKASMMEAIAMVEMAKYDLLSVD